MGGSQREESLHDLGNVDITERETAGGLVDVDGDELTVWDHVEVNNEFLLSSSAILREAVVGHMCVEHVLGPVLEHVSVVLEGDGEIGELNEELN